MKSNFFISLVLASSLCFSPNLLAKTPVKKSVATHQQTAKVVSGNGTQTAYVVLPPGFENKPVVVADSQEYKDLVAQNAELKKQVESEKIWEAKYIAETDQVQQDKAEALKKAEMAEKKSSWFSHIFTWVGWLGGGSLILGAAALIAICVFFPPAIPIIVKWLTWVVEALFKTLEELAVDFEGVIVSIIKKKTPTPVTSAK